MFTELFPFKRGAGLAGALALALALLASPAAPASPAGKSGHAARKSKVPTRHRDAASAAPAPPAPEPTRSEAASRLLAWVTASHDNGSLPFLVIDKQTASLSMFGADGAFVGQTPVLLGIGLGDDSSPGVGAKQLADIGPAERTTPAGRFVAKFGRAFGRQTVLWVDYADSVALHAVITTNKKERRVERLLSPTPDDNRISFGCINVGTRFYTRQLRPLFQKKGGIVYILPDTKSLDDIFPRVRLLPYLAPPSSQTG